MWKKGLIALGIGAGIGIVAYQVKKSRTVCVDNLAGASALDEAIQNGNVQQHQQQQPSPGQVESRAGTSEATQGDVVALALGGNASLLSEKERALMAQLLQLDQEHLFAKWPAPGTDDEQKRRLISQLMALDASYHGGVAAYIRNAQQLLKDSKEGVNSFEGFVPSVPSGTKLDFASPEFLEAEGLGLQQAAHTAFVLVAGGLGERLGYSGIKVALPSESATETPFLGLYIASILALQRRSGAPSPLPLAIMTSDDTHRRTVELLKKHNNFGMADGQVVLLKQEKVACLIDNDAHLALDPADPWVIQTKPHGHGDVHMLLAQSGVAKQWLGGGFKWVCFFQDTNALVFRGLLAALGVSAMNDYDMNSLAVPRKAKEAIGAIAKLVRTKAPSTSGGGSSAQAPDTLTINVEYNQLDPLLRATVNKAGDVNDASGWSPYPGNINQLVLKLSSYVPQLEATGGVISEFVNPKYKDASKTAFKSSTRLECMMQDYPKALPSSAKIGFTTVNQVWASYSPVKNSPADALAKFKEGNPTHSATTGELDIYKANCLALQSLCGVQLPSCLQTSTFNGIATELYPRVVLTPTFAPTVADCKAKIAPGSVVLGPGAVLVLDGPDITVKGPLEVRGALVVRASPGARVTVGPLTVDNKGWSWQPLADGETAPEEERIRGFKVVRHETAEFVFDKPGTYIVPQSEGPAASSPTAAPAAASLLTSGLSPAAKPFVPSGATAKAAPAGGNGGNGNGNGNGANKDGGVAPAGNSAEPDAAAAVKESVQNMFARVRQ